MKLNVIFVISILLMLTTTPVLAQEDTTEGNAGVTPDSIWWGIDVALDKIALALTFDNEARAEKGLKIAEDISEVKIERRFTIDSIRRVDIIAAIVENSGLTEEEIKAVWELKVEEVECTTDADCKEDETCVEGKCEEKEE